MPNWHIEFEVTGKNLDEAQYAVHKLRGVSSIGVRPIAEKDPDKPKAARSPIRPRITEILVQAGQKGISVRDVLNRLTETGFSTTLKKTNSCLHNMKRVGVARTVKTGVYALKGGKK